MAGRPAYAAPPAGSIVIVDEEIDKCRTVAIKICLWPIGQEADRNAGLPNAITLRFGYLKRLERVHSARWSLSWVRWYSTTARLLGKRMVAADKAVAHHLACTPAARSF